MRKSSVLLSPANAVAVSLLDQHTIAAAGSADTGGHEEIAVTARKRAENLQDVRVTIGELSASEISRRSDTAARRPRCGAFAAFVRRAGAA
jgi:outer membrane receptor protein involved in Fe transport